MGYKVVADENVDPGRYGFRIVHETDKTHFFSSEEQAAVREWMKAIMKATIGRDYSSAYPRLGCHVLLTIHRTRGVLRQHSYHTAHGRTGDEPSSKTAFTHGPGRDTKGATAGKSQPTLDTRCADSHGIAILGECQS